MLIRLMLFAVPAICLVSMFGIDYLWLETLLVGAIFAATWIVRGGMAASAAPPLWCSQLRRVARSPVLACALPAAASIVIRLSLLPWIPAPNPVVPDEFSHLLLAKTFLLGRLANPPHVLWPHFESIHILSQPTYSSMYLAGQALFLAVGKLLTGHMFGGVLLGTAAFCAAITWFLRAYVPPGWALYGGMLVAVRIGAGSYWNSSYWGASVAALGAALVMGAYPRLTKHWKPLPAIALTVGALLLVNTRPWEASGLLAVMASSVVYSAISRRTSIRVDRLAVAALLTVSLLVICGWAMSRHFSAVTGDRLTLPYQVNQQTYGWPMTLPWFQPKHVDYRHRELALYRGYEEAEHRLITVPSQLPLGVLVKASLLWRFYFGVLLSFTLLFAVPILRTKRSRVVWIAAAVVCAQVLIEQSGSPHYLSPAAPAIALFWVQGSRHLMQSRRRKAGGGRLFVLAQVPVFCAILITRAILQAPGSPATSQPNYTSWCCSDTRLRDRNWVVEKLEAEPGRQLVLVHYDLDSYDTFEWVYNEPDLDSAKVVFARDMDPRRNQELIDYYPDRKVWQVFVKNTAATVLHESADRNAMR